MGYPSLPSHLRSRRWPEGPDNVEVPLTLRPNLPLGPGVLSPIDARPGVLPTAEPAAPPAGSPVILPLTPAVPDLPTPAVRNPPRTRKRSSLAKWLGTEKATLAVVFTDVVDSTGLWNAQGNEQMVGILRSHFEQGCRLAEVHRGYLIRTTGDALLLVFRTAAAALNFTLAYAGRPGHELIRIRAGLHVGPVQVEGNEVYGATVNYAARVIGKARDAEIWLSSRARSDVVEEKARDHEALQWLPHRQCSLKGFRGKHLLWSVFMPGREV